MGQFLLVYIRFRHIHMQLCLIIQKSCCFIQQFSKKCIILSGDKTLDLSCEGMISRIPRDHSHLFVLAFGHQEPTYSAEGQDYRLGCSSTA